MVEKSIVASTQAYLRALETQGTPILFGVLFGSHITGRATEMSDIDLLVISPRFDGAYDREEVHKLWHIAAKIDERIEPIPCGEIEWREDDSDMIIEVARREGEVVTLD
jgi:predicted nucleotidyltransferase